jgi:CMP/dCMP kinase
MMHGDGSGKAMGDEVGEDVEAARADDRVPTPKAGLVVAIDGPAGAGKSTLARRLARALGLPWINTGLMYRALAAAALESGVDPDDAASLETLARRLRFEVASGGARELLVDGAPPGSELTSPGVEQAVSAVARHPTVREVMRERQRRLGARGSVMEGRDIGTVVFPDADVKIFLSAPPGVRVERRELERGRRGADVEEGVVRRDTLDARTNPLEPAPGAHVLDTTALDAGQVFQAALELVRAVTGEPEGRDGAARAERA